MALQNITSQDDNLNLDAYQPVLLTISLTTLILGIPLAINTLEHLRVSSLPHSLLENLHIVESKRLEIGTIRTTKRL